MRTTLAAAALLLVSVVRADVFVRMTHGAAFRALPAGERAGRLVFRVCGGSVELEKRDVAALEPDEPKLEAYLAEEDAAGDLAALDPERRLAARAALGRSAQAKGLDGCARQHAVSIVDEIFGAAQRFLDAKEPEGAGAPDPRETDEPDARWAFEFLGYGRRFHGGPWLTPADMDSVMSYRQDGRGGGWVNHEEESLFDRKPRLFALEDRHWTFHGSEKDMNDAFAAGVEAGNAEAGTAEAADEELLEEFRAARDARAAAEQKLAAPAGVAVSARPGLIPAAPAAASHQAEERCDQAYAPRAQTQYYCAVFGGAWGDWGCRCEPEGSDR